jgi:hypothetical protein
MTIGQMIPAALLAVTLAGAPALAQMNSDSMSSGSKMEMSRADMKKMKACQRMSHSAMMKNARCAKMMKMHPDMM